MTSNGVSYQILHRMHRSWNNIRTMLKFRGYDVQHILPKIELDVLDAETVKQELDTLANQLCNWNEGCAMIAHRASDSDQIVVFFDAQDTRIGVNSVRLYGECMRKNGYSHAIICAVAGLTPFSEREMQEQQRIHKCRIEMFHYQDLQFCIGTHLLQGAHRLLTEEEKTKLLKKFSLDNEQKLDKIFVADPMARFYDMKPGQVIEFRVCNGSQEPFYQYRVCIDKGSTKGIVVQEREDADD